MAATQGDPYIFLLFHWERGHLGRLAVAGWKPALPVGKPTRLLSHHAPVGKPTLPSTILTYRARSFIFLLSPRSAAILAAAFLLLMGITHPGLRPPLQGGDRRTAQRHFPIPSLEGCRVAAGWVPLRITSSGAANDTRPAPGSHPAPKNPFRWYQTCASQCGQEHASERYSCRVTG